LQDALQVTFTVEICDSADRGGVAGCFTPLVLLASG
jgi:hypothetical protein